MNHRVFVYGTLMSGMPNNRLLATAKLIGPDKIGSEGLAMVSLGRFPGLVESDIHDGDETKVITGEVWEVDDETLANLDRLEGAPDFYHRAEVCLASGGTAEAYILDEKYGRAQPVIDSGDWREHVKQRSGVRR
jgi:gamma-glutamylaminecyclotransferase